MISIQAAPTKKYCGNAALSFDVTRLNLDLGSARHCSRRLVPQPDLVTITTCSKAVRTTSLFASKSVSVPIASPRDSELPLPTGKHAL
jgi:hypothetical protein